MPSEGNPVRIELGLKQRMRDGTDLVADVFLLQTMSQEIILGRPRQPDTTWVSREAHELLADTRISRLRGHRTTTHRQHDTKLPKKG